MQGKAWKTSACFVICAAAIFIFAAGDARAQRDETEYRASLELRLMEMENQMRRMTGQYEEAIHRLTQLTRRLEGALEDVEFRLQSIERGAPASAAAPDSAAPSATGAVPPTGATPASKPRADVKPEDDPERFLVGTTPEERFADAFRLVRREQLDEAEKSFRAFLTVYPDHGLSGNARYWLGKTYFERSKYEYAAITLLETYQRHSDSPKGPDILLYLALSLNEIGQKEDACVAFSDLESRYPDAGAVVRDRAAKGRQDARCN